MTTQLSERETKALEIAARTKLIRKGDLWIVPSQSGAKDYTVDPDPESPRCTCPDFEYRRARCKHIYRCRDHIEARVYERRSHTDRNGDGYS